MRLAGGLANNLYLGRTFAESAKVDAALESLTLEQVNAALKRYLRPDQFVLGVAGTSSLNLNLDVCRSKKAGKSTGLFFSFAAQGAEASRAQMPHAQMAKSSSFLPEAMAA